MNISITPELPQCLLHAHEQSWKLSGEGVLSWTVFNLYRARLYVSGTFYDPSQPFVLDLSYLRTLPAAMIVSASVDELKRLRAPPAEILQSWSEALLRIVPDVTLGAQLAGCFIPGFGVKFYSATHHLGDITDPVFAEAFAAIWLDPDTRSASLRASLLGDSLLDTQAGS